MMVSTRAEVLESAALIGNATTIVAPFLPGIFPTTRIVSHRPQGAHIFYMSRAHLEVVGFTTASAPAAVPSARDVARPAIHY